MPCPDAGYALLLAHRSENTLTLAPGERCADAEWAIAIVALRRACDLGRAPCMYDVGLARVLLAYDDDQPEAGFVQWRVCALLGIADADADALRSGLTVAVTKGSLPDPSNRAAVRRWRALLRDGL
jgi:hypothetical protein